ncbi:aquaporin family protein [Lutimonas saemankumensis]|uniref:MIP/aquaporin family protein n=1 Tax=Lutimonas saemankumensis TaxID=483016 RepID=UPI001CD49D0F|nr:MIP/aquaporin family protein [Lutimonas saemankumensis]MCA0932668.1 aquaporin family protein [Lutimonas saemankumensis]
MSEYLAEFLGTFFLILIGGGVVAGVILKDSKSFGSGWNTIVISWGLAVTFAIYGVGSISGAHINPAVTLGFAFVGEFPWEKVPGYMLSQIGGAFTGATIVWIFYIPLWSKTDDPVSKLGSFATIPAIRSYLHNLISEIIGTAVLIFSLLFIGTTNFTEGLNPLVVGALIMVIGFALGGTTGFAINPARDFGPRLAHFLLPISGKGSSDWNYAFVPILGPIVGSFLGASCYQLFYKNDFQIQYGIVMALVAGILIAAVVNNIQTQKKQRNG